MQSEIISFDTAKLLKAMAVDSRDWNMCGFFYFPDGRKSYWNVVETWRNKNIDQNVIFPAPEQTIIQKWLREKHNIDIEIRRFTSFYNIRVIEYVEEYDANIVIDLDGLELVDFQIYEEALELAIYESLKEINRGITNK